jgi:hypothetical protein
MERILAEFRDGKVFYGWESNGNTIWVGDVVRCVTGLDNVYDGVVVLDGNPFSAKLSVMIEKIIYEDTPEYEIGQTVPISNFKEVYAIDK